MEISVICCLHNNAYGSGELPIESWDEVKEWYIKWGVLYYSIGVSHVQI